MKPLLQRFQTLIRSGAVGVAATAVDLAALFVLVSVLDLSPEAANVPALVLGLLAQFLGNKYFAFQDRSKALVKQGTQFLLVEMGAFVLNAGLFHLLVVATPLPYLAARIFATAVVYFAYSYPLWTRIFRPTAS